MSHPLTAADEQVFFRLLIPEDLLRRAKVVRVTGDEAHAEFGINTEGDGGVVFPYFPPPNGSEQHRLTARLRLDHPSADRKYLCPFADRRHLYFPPCNPEWFARKETPAMLMEAEKSALAILRWAETHSHKLLPIALGGCYGWRGRIGTTTTAEGERVEETGPIPDLDVVNERRVYVLFDANVGTNLKVRAARNRLVTELLLRKCQVWVMDLPVASGINGPDDFLAKFGDSAFFDLFPAATRIEEAPAATAIEALEFKDMSPEVLDGRLGEICQQHMSHFPIAYAWPALLAVASVLVPEPPQPYARANLFVGLVGPVHSGKSQAKEVACAVLEVLPPLLEETMTGSAEGLIKLIGVPGQPRLLWPDELSHLLEKSAIERSSFPYVLNTLWYKNRLTLTIAKQQKLEFDAVLSVLGGLVTENFQHSFSHTTTGGLYDRFLFGMCPTGFAFNYQPWKGEVVTDKPCAVRIAADVWEAKQQWKQENPELADRIAENAIRAALICASWNQCETLNAAALGPARALAEYQIRVRKMLQPNPGENLDARCAFAIVLFLKSYEGKFVKRRDVYNAINANRFGPGVFDRAVMNLEFNGELQQSGKRPKLLRLTGE